MIEPYGGSRRETNLVAGFDPVLGDGRKAGDVVPGVQRLDQFLQRGEIAVHLETQIFEPGEPGFVILQLGTDGGVIIGVGARDDQQERGEYMEWFQPAWDELSEDEQYVLEVFYQDENSYGSYAAETVAEHFGIEHTSAHKKKNRALDHLTVLLFGKA